MRNYFPYLLILMFIGIGCNTFIVQKDDHISSSLKSQIHNLDNQVIDGVIENNPGKILSISSDSLMPILKDNFSRLIQMVGDKFNKQKFNILNDFYLEVSSKNYPVNVMTGLSGDHDYIYSYKPMNKESFVSIGYFQDTLNETSLVLLYSKYGDSWKLDRIDLGTLTIMNKDAFDWYQKAKTDFDSGFYINAGDDIILSKQTLKPGGLGWHYQKEEDIVRFGQEIIAKADSMYNFPITVGYVSTKPEIFRVQPSGISEGYFPTIEYTTSIDLNDITKLSKECDEINNNIGELFHGIDEGNKIIIYTAYNSFPNGNQLVQSHTFIKQTP